MPKPRVSIVHSDDRVYVTVRRKGKEERLKFEDAEGELTVGNLEAVLDALQISNEVDYRICDCRDRSWYGPWHDTACPCHGPEEEYAQAR